VRPAHTATALGCGAILLWSTLATLTSLKGRTVPPFQTTAMTFAIGGLLLLTVAIVRGGRNALRLDGPALALGVAGLFGFHALYFAALRLAPAAEASLITSLWALLIVVLSGLLPGHRLQAQQLFGALLGLVASAVLIGGGMTVEIGAEQMLGLLLALACAVVWAGYSVASRLFADVPSESLAWPCLATAVLALVCSLALEDWVWPVDRVAWMALVLLGLGPVGGAFLLWDIGMKQGHMALLGVLSYAAPILSTSLLVVCGLATPSASLALACVLMVAAAGIASERP
jgi:drug/metabolite transporter (DMT)-like permease